MDIGSGAHRDKYAARNMQNPDVEVLKLITNGPKTSV
jgi:hypothetical protein